MPPETTKVSRQLVTMDGMIGILRRCMAITYGDPPAKPPVPAVSFGSLDGTRMPTQMQPPMQKRIRRYMMVLNARGMTRRGSLDSPATIERYSGPPIQYPATL